jgi:UDP-N-acetylmuramyl pentapeptide synthase
MRTLIEAVRPILRKGALVLLKGSRSCRLERTEKEI